MEKNLLCDEYGANMLADVVDNSQGGDEQVDSVDMMADAFNAVPDNDGATKGSGCVAKDK